MALYSVWALRPCHVPVSRARNEQNTNSFHYSIHHNKMIMTQRWEKVIVLIQGMQTTESSHNNFKEQIRKVRAKLTLSKVTSSRDLWLEWLDLVNRFLHPCYDHNLPPIIPLSDFLLWFSVLLSPPSSSSSDDVKPEDFVFLPGDFSLWGDFSLPRLTLRLFIGMWSPSFSSSEQPASAAVK